MHIRKKYFYKNLTEVDAQTLAIPYTSPELSMVIILPNRIDGLRELEENLGKVNHDSSEFGYKIAEVILALPKFRIENTIDLNGILQGKCSRMDTIFPAFPTNCLKLIRSFRKHSSR